MTISITNHKRGHVGPDGSVLLRQAVFNYSHTTYRFWNQRRNSRRRGAPTDTFRPKLKNNNRETFWAMAVYCLTQLSVPFLVSVLLELAGV